MSKIEHRIEQDIIVKRFLAKMPNKVANSFNEEQLSHIRNAIGAREWGSHSIDIRGTIKLFKWRYYYVVLVGRNKRSLTDKEKRYAALLSSLLIVIFITTSTVFGLLFLYIIKSALGINIFGEWSLGLWNWLSSL